MPAGLILLSFVPAAVGSARFVQLTGGADVTATTAHYLPWLSAPSTGAGALLYGLRMVFGSVMVTGLVMGFLAIRRGQIRRHRAWMTRAYAIGVGAGTQVLTIGFGQALFGKSELSRALLSGVAWVINLAVAEWSISRHGARSRRAAVRIADLR